MKSEEIVYKPTSSVDVIGSHKYLSVTLIFVFTTVATYCIFLFTPMVIGSKRGTRDVGADLLVSVSENQIPIILFCLLVGFIFSFLYTRNIARRKLVTRIGFDDHRKVISLELLHFFTETYEWVRINYDDADVVIQKKYNDQRLEEIKINFRNNEKIFAHISNSDYIWDKDYLIVNAIGKKIIETCKSVKENKKHF